MTVLEVEAAYRLWASNYSPENAVSAIEERLVQGVTPPLARRRLLDVGCGTGRRLARAGAMQAVGIDRSAEMLEVARAACPSEILLARGDVRALPRDDESADVTWCRLVIGHLPECAGTYRELGRVTAIDGWVIVTDFHPDAHAAGHRRTFRSGDQVHEIEHYVHGVDDHLVAAGRAGLRVTALHQGTISEEVRHFYATADRLDLFERDFGLNIVLALAFRRVR